MADAETNVYRNVLFAFWSMHIGRRRNRTRNHYKLSLRVTFGNLTIYLLGKKKFWNLEGARARFNIAVNRIDFSLKIANRQLTSRHYISVIRERMCTFVRFWKFAFVMSQARREESSSTIKHRCAMFLVMANIINGGGTRVGISRPSLQITAIDCLFLFLSCSLFFPSSTKSAA